MTGQYGKMTGFATYYFIYVRPAPSFLIKSCIYRLQSLQNLQSIISAGKLKLNCLFIPPTTFPKSINSQLSPAIIDFHQCV